MTDTIEPNGSDDTRARYGILVQSTGLHSLRQTQCLRTCLSFTSPQCADNKRTRMAGYSCWTTDDEGAVSGSIEPAAWTTRGRVVSTMH